MFLSQRVRVVALWVVCFTMLLSALAPAISHAIPRDAPDGWTEICSVTGALWVLADPSSPDESAAHAPKHCVFCAAHGAQPGLPPTQADGLRLIPLRFALPVLFLHAPQPLFAWASVQARAPPRQA